MVKDIFFIRSRRDIPEFNTPELPHSATVLFPRKLLQSTAAEKYNSQHLKGKPKKS
jgi:hypothetical protein